MTHMETVIRIALIYASVSSTPVNMELEFINIAGENAFPWGMIRNKYAKSTVPPMHRVTFVLFCRSDENRTIRPITHTLNNHHMAAAKNK